MKCQDLWIHLLVTAEIVASNYSFTWTWEEYLNSTLNTLLSYKILKLGFVPVQTIFVNSVLGDEIEVGFNVLILIECLKIKPVVGLYYQNVKIQKEPYTKIEAYCLF